MTDPTPDHILNAAKRRRVDLETTIQNIDVELQHIARALARQNELTTLKQDARAELDDLIPAIESRENPGANAPGRQ